MKIILTAILFLFSFSLVAQGDLYVLAVNEDGNPISGAALVNGSEEIHHFTNKNGIAFIKKAQGIPFFISHSGYYPKLIEQTKVDTAVVIMHKFSTIKRSEERRVEGKKKMHNVFRASHELVREFNADIIQSRSMYMYAVPFDIRGVSGRMVPSIEDSGTVLQSIRKVKYYHINNNHSVEIIETMVDSGLFNNLSQIDAKRIIYNAYGENLDLYPLSNLLYPIPLSDKKKHLYNYYLQDSILVKGQTFYRVYYEPTREYEALFTGYSWVSKHNNYSFESHLKLYANNQVEYIDSLQLSFYSSSLDSLRYPLLQNHEYAVNVLGYKAMLDVRNVFTSFDVTPISDSIRKSKYEVFEVREAKRSKDSLQDLLEYTSADENVFEDASLSPSILSSKHRKNWMFKSQYDFLKSIVVTGNDYPLGPGYFSVHPLLLSVGFNTVEGPYLNARGTYTIKSNNFHWATTPFIRYGFTSTTLYPRLVSELKFNYQDPVTIILEGGRELQQFNPLEPINPLVNSFYSLFLEKNYLKVYEKNYVRFFFDKELARGLEFVMSFEAAYRKALFNTNTFTIFGTGEEYTPNNPDFEPIISAEEGFESHWANIMHFQLYYQFGRRYTFKGNHLVKLKSSLPALRLEYRKGLSFREGMPDYDLVVFGVGAKSRFKNVGILEWDISNGQFLNDNLVHFADYKHFNGVQTAFINRTWDGWTDVRQFSTLPYYDYSTDRSYTEVHIKHMFQGWLLSKISALKRLGWHAYTGYNFLYVNDVGAYNELFLGIENVLNVINLQLAGGFTNEGKFRFSFLIGLNFNYALYMDSKTNRI